MDDVANTDEEFIDKAQRDARKRNINDELQTIKLDKNFKVGGELCTFL